MRVRFISAATAAAVFSSAVPAIGAAPLSAESFAYSKVTAVQRSTPQCTAGVCTTPVRFAGATGTIEGIVVAPAKRRGPAGGVLFVHWLGDDPKTTNHTEFQQDAHDLARHGVVSLLIDTPWAQKDWFMTVRKTATDYAMSLDIVKDLRASLDALMTFNIDPHRLAYVGHDFGAMYGGILSAVDNRPKYFVLMAGTSTFAQWFLLGKKPADIDAYRDQMNVLDPPQYLAHATAASYLLQYATKDVYINAEQAREFYDAVPAPKLVGFYNADHSLNVPQARIDRNRWLLSVLTAD